MEIHLRIPWPITVNKMYHRYAGAVVLSPKARKYYLDVTVDIIAQLKQQMVNNLPITDIVQIEIKAYPPDKRKRDEDNLGKMTSDVLVKAGILQDDFLIKKSIREVFLFNEMTKERGLEIKITPFIQSYGNI